MICKNKILLLFSVLFFKAIFSFSQGEFETEREPDEYFINSFGAKLNSNGFGLYYSFSQRVNFRLRRVYEAEYNFVKDPKEIRLANVSNSYSNPRYFIYGKLNSVHNIKLGYGYNRMIFEKRDKNSISIHLLSTYGLSLSFAKPIYYEYIDYIKRDTVRDKFLSDDVLNLRNREIIGKAPMFIGFKEIKVHPGIYAKFGAAVDFSQSMLKTNVIEVGVCAEGFLNGIEIMYGNKKHFFFSLYLAYHFGTKENAKLDKDYRKELRKNNK